MKVFSGKRWLAAALAMALLLTGAALPALAQTEVRIGGLKGPTTMGVVRLLEENEAGNTEQKYAFTMAQQADELLPLFVKGELDVLLIPGNLASVLYNNTKGNVRLIALSAYSVLYIMEKGGETVSSIADLKGKTLYAPGKGATPEMALAHLLKENGMELGRDVRVEWVSEATEAVQRLNLEETGLALLPQPFATVAQKQVSGLREAVSLQQAWEALPGDSQMVTAVAVARADFLKDHEDAVKRFLADYQKSVEFVNTHVEEAGQLIEAAGIVKAPVAQIAIPKSSLVCVTGQDMQTAMQGYLTVLFDQNPKAVGGALPMEDFYFVP